MNWTAPPVIIRAFEAEQMPAALALSKTFGVPMHDPANSSQTAPANDTGWTLLVKANALTLSRPDGLSTEINFLTGKAVQRSAERNFSSQPLARALGLKKLFQTNSMPSVVDATAGFGTDGWMMASLGCSVRLLEASPVLCTMLEHALEQARNSNSTSAANRISVINTDAVSYLGNAQNAKPDLIYLDPMYPATRSSALVKKGMQLLHELVGPDSNGPALLTAALESATYRVVVKRPKGAALLDGSENWRGQITDVSSAQTRFDIYHIGTG